MQLTCGNKECLYYIILTVIAIIATVLTIDLLGYFLYSYLYVEKYYAVDLKDWRDRELEKYTHIAPGQPGSAWSEIKSPVQEKIKFVTGNREWMWGLNDKKEIYTCKKPCNGETNDHIWRKIPGKLSHVSVGNDYIFGADGYSYFMDKPNGSGKLVKGQVKYKGYIANSGWIWGLYKGAPFKCAKENMCTGLKKDKWIKSKGLRGAIELAPGTEYIWSIDKSGKLFRNKANGDGNWESVKTPTKEGILTISAGNDDSLYAVTKKNQLFKCSKTCNNGSKWRFIEDTPPLKQINISDNIIGLDTQGKLWISSLKK